VFTRSGGVWTQQGIKLVGAGAFLGGDGQGTSVALSADGNTAIVGGPDCNNLCDYYDPGIGAAYVFTRSGGAWSQQGGPLVGWDSFTDPDYPSDIQEGYSVALSADGKTAIVGGPLDGLLVGVDYDVSWPGATWVFTRSGGSWNEQSKLIGTGEFPMVSFQGASVALSADGNTLISGGPGDSSAWVFTRSRGAWSQQGPQLLGAGGSSVALSADGNTAIVSGGSACVFTRSAGVWSQWGNKLGQGGPVALSADGNTAMVGGPGDNSGAGAAYVYTAPSRIKLNITTTPSSGVTGTYVNIIASGFPKGTVNPANVSVKLTASCGGPPLGTTHATSVMPIMGTSERVQFRIPSIGPGLYYVTISDLAAGDANFSSLNCSVLTVAGL
jgi:hypothetical protein